MRTITSGNPDGPYMVVGEAPGEEEDRHGYPLIGASGHETWKMFTEAGLLPIGSYDKIKNSLYRYNFTPLLQLLDREGWFVTNVCHDRPPDNEIQNFFYKRSEAKKAHEVEIGGRFPKEPVKRGLRELEIRINELRPRFILALGETALWALTGNSGITKWRGSVLPSTQTVLENLEHECKILATFHPAYILREYPLRPIALQDMRRARREKHFPEIRSKSYHFITRPSFRDAKQYIQHLSEPQFSNTPLGSDIETPYGWKYLPGHIACIGLGDNDHTAMCIPFMSVENDEGYWNHDQETYLVAEICNLLKSRPIVCHKGIFEAQHFIRHWGCLPNWQHDTMVMQHVLFPGLLATKIDPVTGRETKIGGSLSLAFCASMYNEYYRHWKDDAKDWNQKEVPLEDEWWKYNCEDVARMMECFFVMEDTLRKSNLWEQYRFMMGLAPLVIDMMLRGFKQDLGLRESYRKQVQRDRKTIQTWINAVCGHELNMRSTPQMQSLFYNDLNVPKQFKGRGKEKRLSLDDKALDVISNSIPASAPLCWAVQDYRSLATFEDNFLHSKLAFGDRLFTEINLTGTTSLRFSSTETAFGEGCNLQNIARNPEE